MITAEGAFDTEWGVFEIFEKYSDKNISDECDICGYVGKGFTVVSGYNGWDSYSYTVCPKCFNDREFAKMLNGVYKYLC